MVENSMLLIFSVQILVFSHLVEENEVYFGDSFLRAVDMSLSNPLYKKRCDGKERSSDHDKF